MGVCCGVRQTSTTKSLRGQSVAPFAPLCLAVARCWRCNVALFAALASSVLAPAVVCRGRLPAAGSRCRRFFLGLASTERQQRGAASGLHACMRVDRSPGCSMGCFAPPHGGSPSPGRCRRMRTACCAWRQADHSPWVYSMRQHRRHSHSQQGIGAAAGRLRMESGRPAYGAMAGRCI